MEDFFGGGGVFGRQGGGFGDPFFRHEPFGGPDASHWREVSCALAPRDSYQSVLIAWQTEALFAFSRPGHWSRYARAQFHRTMGLPCKMGWGEQRSWAGQHEPGIANSTLAQCRIIELLMPHAIR